MVREIPKHSLENDKCDEALVSNLLVLDFNEELDKLVFLLLKHDPALHLNGSLLALLFFNLFFAHVDVFHHLVAKTSHMSVFLTFVVSPVGHGFRVESHQVLPVLSDLRQFQTFLLEDIICKVNEVF